jgi:predicted transposase YdaD
LLHIEFQKRADPMMARRVWEYNVLATLEYGCPVYSVVIYLRPTSEIAKPFLIWGLPQFETVHTFRFQNIKLWEQHIADLQQAGLKGLLPLCLLAKGGERHEIAETVFEDLRDQKELLTLALTLASMIFLQEEDQSWLERQACMLEEIISDTWFYKYILQKGLDQGVEKGREEGLEKGLEKGRKEGLEKGLEKGREEAAEEMLRDSRETLFHAVESRFPDLANLAQKQAEHIQDHHAIQHLIVKLFAAQTREDAEVILLNQ